MISSIRGICSPETFAALIEIFDSAWAEIERAGKFRPEEIEPARTALGQIVIAQMDRTDLAETDKVRRQVLEAFWRGQQSSP